MILEGDKNVITAIKEKKRLMDKGEEHGHIKPLLIIDGGLMKGVYGVGAALTMDELDFAKVFTAFGGVSSGSATIAYLLSGNGIEGQRIMYEDCCSKKFINYKRFWNILDPRIFERALRSGEGKSLNAKKILQKSNMYIGVSEYETGAPVLLAPGNEEDLYLALRASVSMPGITNVKTYIKGVRYSDGASTFPLAVEKMITDIEATHVLFITNQDKHTKTLPIVDRLMNNVFFRHRMPRPLRVAASLRWETRHNLVQRILDNPHKPILFVWGDGSIKSFEQNPKIIKSVIEKSKSWWMELLGK